LLRRPMLSGMIARSIRLRTCTSRAVSSSIETARLSPSLDIPGRAKLGQYTQPGVHTTKNTRPDVRTGCAILPVRTCMPRRASCSRWCRRSCRTCSSFRCAS
jgi:hypothetical protein